MTNLTFSTDVDLLQSSLIVYNNTNCLWLEYNDVDDNYIVYSFDLLTKINNWVDLKAINNSCGSNYTKKNYDAIELTQDVCWYYGAINLDGCPKNYTENELNELFTQLELN